MRQFMSTSGALADEFKRADRNRDGLLTEAEFFTALEQVGKRRSSGGQTVMVKRRLDDTGC